MKTHKFLFLILSIIIVVSCDKDEYEYYTLATPVLISADEMRSSVQIVPPKDIIESGKIYAYGNYVFVNDKNKGVHIIDNTDPLNPTKISYINIPGNIDISVKNDMLYANSFTDLVVFDISNINLIKVKSRLKDVFPVYFVTPLEADAVDWSLAYSSNDSFVIDWVITREKRLIEEDIFYDVMMAEAISNTGAGGSLARFKIVDNYLYAVDNHSIHVFDIENLESPNKLESVYAGFDIETIFNRNQYLFLGSMSGMFIYDITNPSTPRYVSEFQHGTACDPVVVDDNYAYITLRAGNSCGAFESSLQIVDITNIEEPVLKKSYLMDNPYGLGIINENIFICDGDSGLKVYDKSDILNLELVSHFENITAFDVIPLQNHLLLIGDKILYQYRYIDGTIEKLSEFNLN